MYKKRSGTSGIRGQLYETKLLSLLLFRAQHHDNIQEFYLGSNIDEIGIFDDICFKAKVKGHNQPVAIFIQAKHTENDDKVVTLNNKNDLAKYFESYMKIKAQFHLNNENPFFKHTFDETECVFVLYTTKQSDFSNVFNGNSADILNDLIATGDLGSQPAYVKDDIEFLCNIALKEEVRTLATHFFKFIVNKSNDMNDDLILRYHVILAKKVINVSELQPDGSRIGSFRADFFCSKDEFIILFKYKFYEEVLKSHANIRNEKEVEEKEMQDLLSSFLSKPSELTLGTLIKENIIMYKNGKLQFHHKIPVDIIHQLEKINLPQSELEEAIKRAVKYILLPLKFCIPASFGNKDLTLKGNQNKVERRINHLTNKIIELIQSATGNTIVIYESDEGFLQLNGGIGGVVGNLLVYDEKNKLFKFTDNLNLLEKYSQILLRNLQEQIINLSDYRLDVRSKNFPKLSLNCECYQDLARDFFSKLVFYTNQEDENGVGKILKQEIDDYEGAETKNFQVKSDAIFLNFHDEVQTWWMQQKSAKYLTKTSDLYPKAKYNILNDPMTSVVSMMYMTEIKNIGCTFKESHAIILESLDLKMRNVIVTDITRLTFIKLTQNLKRQDYVVLDLKYILNLPKSDFRALNLELKNVSEEKLIIIVCDNTLHRNLQDIARAVSNKRIIVITNMTFLKMIMKHFSPVNLLNDEGNSLFELSQDSQNRLINNAKAIFQGQEVSLNLLIDDISVKFIKGSILNKIIQNEMIAISEPLELPERPFELLSYDKSRLKYEIKDLYVDRRVSHGKTGQSSCKSDILRTLHDINDDVVLITAKPGMGKSTLLSYLSITTKDLDKKLWVMRINLLDHSKEFSDWKKNKTVINLLEVLHFLCVVILKQKISKINSTSFLLSECNNEVILKECTYDEWITFGFEMFLHCFKNGNIVFLFDGFDEICPHYSAEVVSFLNVIKTYPRKHKMWITSRPYNKIKSVLVQNFGILEPYELVPLSDNDQEIYFEKFWKYNFKLHDLNDTQINNLGCFINYMTKRHEKVFSDNFIRINKPQTFLLNKVYFHFMIYLQSEIKYLPMAFPLSWNYRDKLNVSVNIARLSQDLFRRNMGDKGINDILEFVGTPLHMYLVADYFLSAIKNGSQNSDQWDLDINTYAIYESFLESKLKKIRFQDKNKMDIDNPDIIETYETVRKEFIGMHKKLAAYAMFYKNGHEIFNNSDLKEINSMMNKIETGSEKTGLIYSVSNDTPQFIHMTFTEYFAVEYISDLLKKSKNEKQKEISDFIVNTMIFESPVNVLNILDQKLKLDKEFALAIKKHEKYIFKILMVQTEEYEYEAKSLLLESISKNLDNFLTFFMTTLANNVNENNLGNFIKLIVTTGFLKLAVKMRYDDLVITVFSIIKKINKSKWREFVSNPQNYCEEITTNLNVQRILRHQFLNFSVLAEVIGLDLMNTHSEAA